MTVEFGFCIESREDGEMPETLAAGLTMHKINVDKAVRFGCAAVPETPAPVAAMEGEVTPATDQGEITAASKQ